MGFIAQTSEFTSVSGIWERLGVAGILVVAAYFMMRYFIDQQSKKDERIAQLTNEFVSVARQFASVVESNSSTMEAVQHSVDKLTDEFRQALGTAIVGAAREAIQGAARIAERTADHREAAAERKAGRAEKSNG